MATELNIEEQLNNSFLDNLAIFDLKNMGFSSDSIMNLYNVANIKDAQGAEKFVTILSA